MIELLLLLLPFLFLSACAHPNAGGGVPDTLHSGPLSQIEIVSEKLRSGYTVVVARTPPVAGQAPRILVASYVLQGSMQESRIGWAHLMEHIVADNRATIAGPPRPDSVKFFDGNALTRPYYTSFVSVLPAPLLPATLHSRMARAGRSANDSTVFATEVGRVIAELERDETGQYPAYKAVVALATNHSPRLADEIGVVRQTDRNELAEAIHPIYRPDNAVLVIAGDLNIDSTRALVHETAARLKLSEIRNTKPGSLSTPMIVTNRSAVLADQNRSGHNVIAVAWPKPSLGDKDQLPLLVADALLLGRGDSIEDPKRSDSSPIAIRLARTLGGWKFWDGRAGKWQAPYLADTGPQVMAIVFNTDSTLTPDQIRAYVKVALREVHRYAMSDADIERARASLASFYERWFFEPTYRILADHLMAYVATGRDPNDVKKIPSEIRNVKPNDVREVIDRYLIRVEPDIVVLSK